LFDTINDKETVVKLGSKKSTCAEENYGILSQKETCTNERN